MHVCRFCLHEIHNIYICIYIYIVYRYTHTHTYIYIYNLPPTNQPPAQAYSTHINYMCIIIYEQTTCTAGCEVPHPLPRWFRTMLWQAAWLCLCEATQRAMDRLSRVVIPMTACSKMPSALCEKQGPENPSQGCKPRPGTARKPSTQ